jgi:hypothetical protein
MRGRRHRSEIDRDRVDGEHHEHQGPPADEQELRARLEEELKKITVRDVLVQTVVTLINLGGQRLGLSEASKDAADPGQTRVAIEAVRSLLPLLEADERSAEQVKPIKDALAQLQMAYAQLAGGPAGPAEQAGPSPEQSPEEREAEPRTEPPPARPSSSGRLWVPPGTNT